MRKDATSLKSRAQIIGYHVYYSKLAEQIIKIYFICMQNTDYALRLHFVLDFSSETIYHYPNK